MKTIKDYPIESRFYTGCYSGLAEKILKNAVQGARFGFDPLKVVRAEDKELAVVVYARYYYDNYVNYKRIGITPDMMREKTIRLCEKTIETDACLQKENTRLLSVLVDFFSGKTIDESNQKSLKRLIGRKPDAIASEISCCVTEETAKFESQRLDFTSRLEKYYNRRWYMSLGQVCGLNHKWPTIDTNAERPENPIPAYIGEDRVTAFLNAELELMNANNALAAAFDEYEKKRVEFKRMKQELVRLAREKRDSDVKALKKEFREAKRISGKTEV